MFARGTHGQGPLLSRSRSTEVKRVFIPGTARSSMKTRPEPQERHLAPCAAIPPATWLPQHLWRKARRPAPLDVASMPHAARGPTAKGETIRVLLEVDVLDDIQERHHERSLLGRANVGLDVGQAARDLQGGPRHTSCTRAWRERVHARERSVCVTSVAYHMHEGEEHARQPCTSGCTGAPHVAVKLSQDSAQGGYRLWGRWRTIVWRPLDAQRSDMRVNPRT